MKVILGVTGCIGAYKSALILRRLQEQGCEVLPVMTRAAREFITPLTLEKLSGNRVISDLFEDPSARIEHIARARESDLLLVAPATANILAKFARGVADDFLSTLYLSTLSPVVVAPAMNVEMWRHPATRENVEILKGRGVAVVEPEDGYLACGELGEGRLADPEDIVETAMRAVHPDRSLKGRRVLVTAGPTVEDLDPVRFLSNRSSGKMGVAVAREALRRGAVVTLVSGPLQVTPPREVEWIQIRSAAQMAEAVLGRFEDSDIVVMAAAVADYRPVSCSAQKLRKDQPFPQQWQRTTDILKELGGRKQAQYLVGFAAESGPGLDEARRKLKEKNLDLVVANDIAAPGQGFQSDDNQVTLLDSRGGEESLPRMSKVDLAGILWDRILSLQTAPEGGAGSRTDPLHGLTSS